MCDDEYVVLHYAQLSARSFSLIFSHNYPFTSFCAGCIIPLCKQKDNRKVNKKGVKYHSSAKMRKRTQKKWLFRVFHDF